MATVKDFIARYGIYAQGTSVVSSSTGQTGAFQVDGGAAVAKNLIVGTGATVWGNSDLKGTLTLGGGATLNSTLSVAGLSTLANVTASGTLYVGGEITANSTLNVAGNTTLSGTLGVTGSTNLTGPLTANTATFNGPTNVSGSNSFTVGTGATSLGGTLGVNGVASFNNNTTATTAPAGAIVVTGGAYVGNNLIVEGIGASTVTNTANSLYVAGGAWIDRTFIVSGDATFRGNVIFNGTQTNVYSTNTVYTDNILNLHVPAGSTGTTHTWTIDDGKDIGLMFHYYKASTDKDGFLGFVNSSGYLEWFENGFETTAGVTSSTVHGTFRTGDIILTKTTNNSGNATTGALVVAGGVGVGEKIFATGDISGGTLTGRGLTQGRVIFAGANGTLTDNGNLTFDGTTLTGTVTSANSATNIKGGLAGQLVYQTGPNATGFVSTGTSGFILQSNGTAAPTWVSLGAVSAGLATTASNIAAGTTNQIPYQLSTGSTAFFGPGVIGQLLMSNGTNAGGPTFVNTGNIYVGAATNANNLFLGSAGQIPIQSGVGTTSFIPTGSAGQLLQAQTGNTATFVNTSSVYIGRAVDADKWVSARTLTLAGDLGGNVSFDGSTNFTLTATIQPNSVALGTDTTGDYVSNGATSGWGISGSTTGEGQTFTVTSNATASNTTSTIVFRDGSGNFAAGTITANLTGVATTATNIASGSAGQIPIQSSTGTTAFIPTGTAGQLLQAGTNTATFVSTASVYVGSAVNAQNLFGGNVGQLHYQSATGTSGFVGTGTAGQILMSNGPVSNGPSFVNTNTFRVGFADTSTNIAGGTVGQIPYQSAVGITSFSGPGNAGEILVSRGTNASGPLFQNTLTLAGTNNATSTTTGALQVVGGIGVGQALFVGGKITVTDTTESSSTNQGSIITSGGVGIAKNLNVGGTVTVGSTTAGSVVPAVYSNNVLLASYTSPVLSAGGTVNLDTYTTSTYRTAKYAVQIVDGSNVHATEILVTHNGTTAYINEYGIVTSGNQLGTFDATLSGGTITLTFTPNPAPTAMTIKVVRFGITA